MRKAVAMLRKTWGALFLSLVVLTAFVPLVGASSGVKSPPAVGETPVPGEWDNVVKAARKEGEVLIYSEIGSRLKKELENFTQKYGIQLKYMSARAPELAQKIISQQRNGLYDGDILLMAIATTQDILKPAGALEPLNNHLILPEVLDARMWWRGRLPWVDNEHYQVLVTLFPIVGVVRNKDLVRAGELKSYRDLLNPKWKRKIVIDDPSILGAGNSWFTGTGGIMGIEYLRELGRQEPVVSRDMRLMLESVAKGKYPIAIGSQGETYTEFRRAGAPVEKVRLQEGETLDCSIGAISLLARAAHPHAAKVFINWALGREGALAFSRGIGGQSARVDVPADFLDAAMVRQQGVKYSSNATVDAGPRKREWAAVAKSIFSERGQK